MISDHKPSSGPRVVFMGSPDFAIPAFEGLIEDGYEVVLAVSQPDRPAGRGRRIHRPAITTRAEQLGVPTYQPATLRDPSAHAPIEAAEPDLIVVAAFGLLLPKAILEIPRYHCLNVHASLLPRHRGAAPIQAAILAGDSKTGISIMVMDEGMDTGAILAQRATPIEQNDDTPTLERRLADLGRELLLATIPGWIDGSIQPGPQDDAQATYAPRIKRADANLDWQKPAELCARAVRAYRGWPNAHTTWQGQTLLILEAEPLPGGTPGGPPGRVLVDPHAVWSPAVVTGDGLLHLRQVQLQGRRTVTGRDFVNGQPSFRDAILGP